MSILLESHKQIVEFLIKFEVKFLVIGGYAVNIYGYSRTTGDIDIWLEPTSLNQKNFLKMLKELKFQSESIQTVSELDFSLPNAFHIGEKPLKVDFLTKIAGLEFHDSFVHKNIIPLDRFDLPVLSLNDLIISKSVTGRLRDQNDIEELQKVQKLIKRNKKS